MGAESAAAVRVSAGWDPVPWDSRFFAVPIGRIALDTIECDALIDVERDARAAGIACLYAELDAGDASAVDLAQRAGYRLVDVALDLEHPTNVLTHRPPTASVVRPGTPADVERLRPQLDVVAPWSRFAVDPRFGLAAARELHRAWSARAATGSDGRLLLVAEHAGAVTGMLTARCAPTANGRSTPRIDLIASTEPGSGASQALVGHAFERFGPGPSRGGPIAARNVTSLRFCEHMGYRVASVRYLFHRWLDETSPDRHLEEIT